MVILITGAAGQIAYSLVFMVAKGDMFGKDQKLVIHLLDIPPMLPKLAGVEMELQDCGFPLVEKVVVTDDLKEAFCDIDVALMVGSMPRKEGMERSDLLKMNIGIFKTQGQALDQYAKKTVKVLVVGNPANTNAWAMSHFAPSIPKENFSALTRLDFNRAIGKLAVDCNVSCEKIKNPIIWGNHSLSQFPDVTNATVDTETGTKSVYEIIKNDNYLKNEFVQIIQKRGGEVIKARGASSALSAAKAITDHMHDWWCGTKPGIHVSMSVICDENPYGVPKNLMFSYPVTIANKKWTVVPNLKHDDWAKTLMDKTTNELIEERDTASQFLN
ncbi:hypothetical protein Ciccas_005218 [Cichlidogyrus casuarinus]|uniref:Malate dehydrogenase n=1 Tax=Cichlidogyrus casuarinus TaxID=1844966 RepID=A0ABD2Q993_9PLAT